MGNGEGPNKGKIAAIVNVIDQNRVLVDGPTSGVLRQAYPIKQLQLTPIAVKSPFNACTKVVRAELVANKVCIFFEFILQIRNKIKKEHLFRCTNLSFQA